MTPTMSPNRPDAPSRQKSGSGDWIRNIVLGIVALLSLTAFAGSGWYLFTGQNPLRLIETDSSDQASPISAPPRIGMAMPPVTQPQAPESAAEPPKPPAAEPTQEEPPLPAIRDPLIPPGGARPPPSFAQFPARTDLKPLGNAPLPELLRDSPSGPLPIAAKGQEPRTAYARPFASPPGAAKVAVVVVGLGLSREATEAAIMKLPPEISLSFSPYASNLDGWMRRARAHGHEVLLDLPLEPANFPMRDPGPLAILARQSPAEALQQLQSVLGRMTAYVGLSAGLSSPVSTTEQWPALLQAIRSRGLLFVGDGLVGVTGKDLPAAAPVTLVADEVPFRAAIDARLLRLQTIAERQGSAVAYASPRPVTFDCLLTWSAQLPQKGLALAPVSALAVAPP